MALPAASSPRLDRASVKATALEVVPVKRILMFALPMMATFMVLGIGVLAMRVQGVAMKTRLGAVPQAVSGAVEQVAEEIAEVLE